MTSGKGLLAGRPIKDIDLRIIPDLWGSRIAPLSRSQFDAVCLPPGQVGEIVVSGNHVLPGYWKGRGNHETKFKVSGATWHRTGDAGYLDGKGRLWLLGRCIVRRSACVAFRNRRTLALESQHPFSSKDIAALKAKLSWAAIDRIAVLKRLPVDPRHNAKIDYPALNALLKKFSENNQPG